MRKQRFWLLAFMIASLVSLAAQPAFADPSDDLAAAKKAFQNVNSVHIEFMRPQVRVGRCRDNLEYRISAQGVQL